MTAVQQLGLFDEGRREQDLKQQGIGRAVGHEDATWKGYASLKLEELAKRQPFVHVDDLYPVIEWFPRNPNSWGAIWQSAIRRGVLRKTGRTRPTKLPGKHAHAYPCYESLIYGRPKKD